MTKTAEEKRASHAAYMREYTNRRKLAEPEYAARILARSARQREGIRNDPEALALKSVKASNKRILTITDEIRAEEAAKARKKREDGEYRKRQSASTAKSAKKRRPAINARRRELYAEDPSYRFAQVLRARLAIAFKKQKTDKAKAQASALKLVGCTMPELAEHLARQFQPGMTHKNYGEWEIDHRIPVSKFNLVCPLARVLAFHFTNLQPLMKSVNRKSITRCTILHKTF